LKKEFEATNAMYPLPVVLVTTHDGKGNDNIITIAWTSNVSRKEPCVCISIGGEKLSFKNIKNTGDFVVNIPDQDILKEVDFCGENHGDEVNKFKETGLTPQEASMVGAKLIRQCPINIECKLRKIYQIEGANLVIGQVLKVHMDEKILKQNQSVDYVKLNPVVYAQKTYFTLGKAKQKRGFSKDNE